MICDVLASGNCLCWPYISGRCSGPDAQYDLVVLCVVYKTGGVEQEPKFVGGCNTEAESRCRETESRDLSHFNSWCCYIVVPVVKVGERSSLASIQGPHACKFFEERTFWRVYPL